MTSLRIGMGLQLVHRSSGTPNWAVTIAANVTGPTCALTGDAQPPGPLSIFNSADVITWRRSEDMVYNGSNILTAWPDKVGGTALASIAGSPVVTASDATLNNRPTLNGDGVDDNIVQTLDRPAPGTESTTIIMIVKQITWTSADCFCGANTSAMVIRQTTATPGIALRNTTVTTVNNGLTLGTWKMVIGHFGNTTADYCQVGNGAQATGINAGNTDPIASFGWLGRNGADFSNIQLAEMIVVKNLGASGVTGGQLSSLTSYFNTLYPSSVTT